jgi:hypothetical protein
VATLAEILLYPHLHPGRDVHVTQLLGGPTDLRVPTLLGGLWKAGSDVVTTGYQGHGPILDSKAKTEYKQRIDELRKDLEEAARFNDSYRATNIRCEMGAVAEQLAAAVGLGGRDRCSSSEAERARSAVTKRIKEAINRIADVIPRSAATWPRESKPAICALTPRTRIARSPGSSDSVASFWPL